MNALQLTRGRITGVAAAAALAAAAAAAIAAPAPSAHAWVNNPNVTVTGKVTSCGAPGPIQYESVRANLNGQIATWGALTSAQPAYALHWTNVPPGNGGWAFYVVHCSGPVPDHSGWVHVQQPLVGSNWNGGNI